MEFGPIAFVGFGEAAGAFLKGWAPGDPSVIRAYDIKTDDAGTRDAMLARFAEAGVQGCSERADALRDAAGVFCVVTAEQALVAAEAAASEIAEGAFWFDCNSCAPETKRQAAKVIEAAGGRYVDVAVMAPVYPKLHRVPLNIAGPHADAAAEALSSLGMVPKVTGGEVGHASSIKMIRSVMIKGMEALFAECFLSARKAGVEDAVIASLKASNPEIDWDKQAAYNLERMMVHGARRAAEMREVAKTVRQLGLSGDMAAGAAAWQDTIAALELDPGEDDALARIDAVLAALKGA